MEAIRHLSGRALTPLVWALLVVSVCALGLAPAALAQTSAAAPAPAAAAPHQGGGEASLKLPDLAQATFVGMSGRTILQWGLLICLLGLAFGLVIYSQLKNLPVHQSMRDISELIYETCKTYLITQGKFLAILEVFIAVIIVFYFGFLQHFEAVKVFIILLFSVIGILGLLRGGVVRHPHQHLRQLPHRLREPRGQALPGLRDPDQGGHEHRHAAGLRRAVHHALHPALHPARLRGTVLHRLRHRGVARGRRPPHRGRHLHQDRGHRLRPDEDRLQHQGGRRAQPGVIADCTGDNAGDSVGPTADGFETYGVTGVALITFILLAVPKELVQVQLLVWIFVMRVIMIVASGASYLVNEAFARARYASAAKMSFEAPLTSLVWVTSIVSVVLTYVASWLMIPDLGDGSLWWKLSTVITCGTLAGAIIPEFVKVFTSTNSAHVREVVTSAREGGASLGILSGLVAGNFSAYWLGLTMVLLMGIGYGVSTMGLGSLMAAPAVFAFGLVAFGFLGMGPVTIAVDSYGPVTDNAQSVFELSVIETLPGIKPQLKREFGFDVNFEAAKHLLEENDGAGNTFKATAKPVLIGTAVVGATTMIFSIIVLLTAGLTQNLDKLSLLHAPFLLGLISGGAVIYWFTGASIQAVTTGAYRAVEFIKANIRLEGATKASIADSKRVVEICTQYAQKGMFNIFLAVFFATLAFAFAEPYFFVGYLISIALFGLYQAIFMANAGGAWDNAKKVVEVDLKEKGTPLHAATVVGDTVGDPFKDTSSVAMNPIIKFTTLFGLLAVELAVSLTAERGSGFTTVLAAVFFLISVIFVWRSFYAMRIKVEPAGAGAPAMAKH